jgi:hypothetical protein
MNILHKASATFNRRILQTQSSAAFSQLTMAGEESKHRIKVPMYDLEPQTDNCFVAPNSTIGKYLPTLFIIIV